MADTTTPTTPITGSLLSQTGSFAPGASQAGTPAPLAVDSLGNPITPINLPTPPTTSTNGLGSLASVTSQANSIATPYTDSAKAIIDRINTLQGSDLNKTADTQTANTNAGVDTATKNVQDITNQINALNAESATSGLQIDQNNDGKGLVNAIGDRQKAEANRQLSIKSNMLGAQLSAAQGNLKLAQDQAQKVIDLHYQPIEQEITQKQQQLQLIAPFLTAEQKTVADAQTAKLTQQATDLADKKKQQQDVVNAAQTAGDANTAAAALKLDPNSSTFATDLANVQKNLAPDPAKQLSIEGQRLDNQNKILQNQKLQGEIATAKAAGNETVAIVAGDGSIKSVPVNVAPYYNVSANGTEYVDASTLVGTATEKSAIITAAQKAGYKIITNKNTAADLVNIKDANAKLDTVSTIMDGIGQPGWLARTLGGAFGTQAAAFAESDPQKAASGALQSIGLDVLKAISGIQGFRGNQTAIQQVTDHLPKITDTVDTINSKVDFIKQLIDDRENSIVGPKQTTSSSATDQVVNGITYTVGSDGLYYPKK